ncbi:Proline-rich protein [Quillaja saponaria]|uniref:Proline-rich protein n=1 Tax=Quillaja saponaria TaxID=32244 RepID=A0AAD7P587_QUISA|nr:Proline-rich protein [Quillaja saponaria]
MTQMWLLWSSKNSPTTTTKSGGESGSTATAATISSNSLTSNRTSCHCCLLVTKLVRKLKRHRPTLKPPASRQSSFQCRYDPMSYSLNFDASG